ncbi:MAG: NAD(P)H-binding protein [Motiliproteus sp.]
MKITVLGAAGKVGRRVVNEALSRGHDVTAVVRNSTAIDDLAIAACIVVGDVANIEDVINVSSEQEVVISAIRPLPDNKHKNDLITRTLMEGLAETGVRLLVVGGAATLTVPGTGGDTVMEDANFLPVNARPIGQASADQLQACQAEKRVDWAYLSPAAQLSPGKRTGSYRLGRDDLLLDAAGNSTISMEDLAVVLLDEAERPQHHQIRFTAAY